MSGVGGVGCDSAANPATKHTIQLRLPPSLLSLSSLSPESLFFCRCGLFVVYSSFTLITSFHFEHPIHAVESKKKKTSFTKRGAERSLVALPHHAEQMWSNDNELWDSVVVRNLFARCGSFSCLVSTAAAGQQFVDREGGRVPRQDGGNVQEGHRSWQKLETQWTST